MTPPSGIKKAESIVDEVLAKTNGNLSDEDCNLLLEACMQCAYPNGILSEQAQEKELKETQKFGVKLFNRNFDVPKSIWMDFIHGMF